MNFNLVTQHLNAIQVLENHKIDDLYPFVIVKFTRELCVEILNNLYSILGVNNKNMLYKKLKELDSTQEYELALEHFIEFMDDITSIEDDELIKSNPLFKTYGKETNKLGLDVVKSIFSFVGEIAQDYIS